MELIPTPSLVRSSQSADLPKDKNENQFRFADIRNQLVSSWDGKSLSAFKVVKLNSNNQLPLIQYIPLHLEFFVEKFSEISTAQHELERKNPAELKENEAANQKLEFYQVLYNLEMELKNISNPFLKKAIAEIFQSFQGIIDISSPDTLLPRYSEAVMPKETFSSVNSFLTFFCRKAYENYNIDRFVDDFKLKMKSLSQELLESASEKIEDYRKTWPEFAIFLSLPPIIALNDHQCRLLIEYTHLCYDHDKFTMIVTDLIKLETLNIHLKSDSTSLLHEVIRKRPVSFKILDIIQKSKDSNENGISPNELKGKRISLFDPALNYCIFSCGITLVATTKDTEERKSEFQKTNITLDNQFEILIDSKCSVTIRKQREFKFWLGILYNVLSIGDKIIISSHEGSVIPGGQYIIEDIGKEKKLTKKQFAFFEVTISNAITRDFHVLSCYVDDATEAIYKPTVSVKFNRNRSRMSQNASYFGENFLVKKEVERSFQLINESNINQKILIWKDGEQNSNHDPSNQSGTNVVDTQTKTNGKYADMLSDLMEFTSFDEKLSTQLQNLFLTIQGLLDVHRKSLDRNHDFILCIGNDEHEGKAMGWLDRKNLHARLPLNQNSDESHAHHAHPFADRDVSFLYYPMSHHNVSQSRDCCFYERLIADYRFEQTMRNAKLLSAIVILLPLREFIFDDLQKTFIYFLANIKLRFPWLVNEKNISKIHYLLTGEGDVPGSVEQQIFSAMIEALDPAKTQQKLWQNFSKSELISKNPPDQNKFDTMDLEDHALRDELVKKYTENGPIDNLNNYEPSEFVVSHLIDFLKNALHIALIFFKGYDRNVKKDEVLKAIRQRLDDNPSDDEHRMPAALHSDPEEMQMVSLDEKHSPATLPKETTTQNSRRSEDENGSSEEAQSGCFAKKIRRKTHPNPNAEAIKEILKKLKDRLDELGILAQAVCQDYSKNEKSKELGKILLQFNKLKNQIDRVLHQ